jgi:hypothetical protein
MELNRECLSKRVPECLRLFPVFFILLSGIIILQSCSYSFTGSSVPSHLKSISIPVFVDKSGSGEFDLNRKLTNQLIQKFIDDNTLIVSTNQQNADSFLDGTIIALSDAPNIVSGGEKVTSRRITITVRAVYKDLVKKKQIFEKNFSNYGDYIVGGDITSVRNAAIQTALDKITEDILLGVVSNW